MMKLVIKLWKDPVWSKIIAVGIITVIAATGSYLLNLWPSIKNIYNSFIKYLSSTTEISNWIIGIMATCTILIIIAIVAIIWNLIFPNDQNSSWRNYRTDDFFNLKWHWNYDSNGGIYNLYSCCSKCHYQVLAIDASTFNAVPRITYHCDSCNETVNEFEGTEYELEHKVKRFIQQKIRTDSWSDLKNA